LKKGNLQKLPTSKVKYPDYIDNIDYLQQPANLIELIRTAFFIFLS